MDSTINKEPSREKENLISYILQIRFVKLRFKIRFCEDAELPATKGSALRGGLGNMLLNAYCIKDRQCETCDFQKDCLVQNMMYSEMPIQPAFMTQGNSVGYNIDCCDYRTYVKKNDCLEFSMTLFGKNLLYFNLYLNGFYALGMQGLGKNRARFSIVSVTNTEGEPIMDGMNILMEKYKIATIEEYVSKRLSVFENKNRILVNFLTPLNIKYHGEIMKAFDLAAIFDSICRRIYIMNCFEGIETELYAWKKQELPLMEVIEQRNQAVKRFSERKSEKILLHGLEGKIIIGNPTDEQIKLLLAGEVLQIGKNTSFGFGKISVKSC